MIRPALQVILSQIQKRKRMVQETGMPRQHEGNQSMNRTENTKARIIITILLGIAAVFLYFFALDKIQYRNGRYRIQTEMAQAVKNLEKTKKESRESFDSMELSMSLLYMQDARTLGTFAQLDPGFEISDDYLSMINQTLSVEDMGAGDDHVIDILQRLACLVKESLRFFGVQQTLVPLVHIAGVPAKYHI